MQRMQVFLRTYNAHRSRGVWGHAPPGKFFYHMRALLRPSETTITMQNLWQLNCNSGNSSYDHFSEPLLFRISLCIRGTAADFSALCLQNMKQ